ncbi:MAG: YicC family protein [Luminiphilus sp.]|nr:YicC family protein [Luminiphilus sp.]
MTQSMTGFARGSVTTGEMTITVELRSVNNRFLDLHIRCPESLRVFEQPWRRKIGEQIHRGKVELHIKLNDQTDNRLAEINSEGLSRLHKMLDQVARVIPDTTAPDQLSVLAAPGVLLSAMIDEDALGQYVAKALDQALSQLVVNRREEGAVLATVVLDRVATMRELLDLLKANLPILREQQEQRILHRLAQIDVEPDAKRLEEELVYSAQKSDVEEELDRLDAHLNAIEKALQGSAPCGRRLDFLMQELNREANTLSSKATALSTTETAVEFKVLIEQMREQIQNIE